jgi:hypothetical protein
MWKKWEIISTKSFPAVCSPYKQVLQKGGRGVNSTKNVSSVTPITVCVQQDVFPATICYENLSDN